MATPKPFIPNTLTRNLPEFGQELSFDLVMNENLTFINKSTEYHLTTLDDKGGHTASALEPNAILRVNDEGTGVTATHLAEPFFDGGFRFKRAMNFQNIGQLNYHCDTDNTISVGSDAGRPFVELQNATNSASVIEFPRGNRGLEFEAFVMFKIDSGGGNVRFNVSDYTYLLPDRHNSLEFSRTGTGNIIIDARNKNQVVPGIQSGFASTKRNFTNGIFFVKMNVVTSNLATDVSTLTYSIGRYNLTDIDTALQIGDNYRCLLNGDPNNLVANATITSQPVSSSIVNSLNHRALNLSNKDVAPTKVYHVELRHGSKLNNNVAET